MMAQFHDFYLKETLPAMQKGGVKQQSVWTSARLGESFEYITIRPIEGIQYFDEPGEIAKALGEEGTRKWAAKRGTMIVRSQSYTTQDRPEMSIAPNANEVPKLIFVSRRTVAPGRATEYENHFKTDILPIFKKANPKGFVVRKVGTGGDQDEYIAATMMDSFADYGKWVEAVMKEGYTAANDKRAGLVTHQETAVYRYVPDEAKAQYGPFARLRYQLIVKTIAANHAPRAAATAPPAAAPDEFRRGVEQYEKGDLAGALALFEQAIKTWRQTLEAAANGAESNRPPDSGTDPATLYYWRGLVRYDYREWNGALSDFDQAIRYNPRHLQALIKRGNACLNKGDHEDAIRTYNKALAVDPKSPLIWNNRGLAWLHLAELEAARNDFNHALELDPRLVAALSNRAGVKHDQTDFVGALSDYDKAIRLAPQLALLYNNRGVTRKALDDLAGALSDYNRAIALRPGFRQAYLNRSRVLLKLHRTKEAATLCNAAPNSARRQNRCSNRRPRLVRRSRCINNGRSAASRPAARLCPSTSGIVRQPGRATSPDRRAFGNRRRWPLAANGLPAGCKSDHKPIAHFAAPPPGAGWRLPCDRACRPGCN
jgi:tetratricopeptide (TPR) repeat protein